ncbi:MULTISPECIES: NarK/NasA family nitrate transporter [unclassified Novosphingobium]|uniref:nitrate/nitrite transporter n=2 Tax=Novosphingobium TaxID=165696 RepID=UPI0014429068|nr:MULTISPECIES: nitrate/nitrite transporter [unclassified Novosphingobium]MBB3558662.1 NNP family nitrate/nitrite transporter-like MFS transporter [Novosphingobium sp. BK349]MBB3360535.1 NNP family nitrate/nitrite transporter-like MFS transporter [Novosphingobium sp. BK256]MBB3376937.1 NNP family nitrate/nitrite transporter-like MFS transporter [Novosphingobium sp. BK280]MBB3422997.1 NNP family nitrate/nitrite transporter-like MFS transporter [Novosphingobium sp. BK267]MBB3451700.1 NNP family
MATVAMPSAKPAPQGATTSFWKSGHSPTLLAAFLYFDMAFMVWVLLGPLAPIISKELGLDPAQKGMMVAIPTLAGAVIRLINGVLVDRIGPKLTGTISQIVVIAGLFVAWHFGISSYQATLALGVILGFAGASFAVSLPLASRWYPPEHQGKAMGIAGMGNSGTVFASLFAALLAKAYGWTNVFGFALIPLIAVFAFYLIAAKDSPDQPAPKPLSAYASVLREADAWWFMLFYFVTFGGFVGLSSSLPTFYADSFGVTPVIAGYCTAAAVFMGSLLRPMGGALADRFGGIRTLTAVYVAAAVLLGVIAMVATSGLAIAVVLFVAVMGTLGVGNGAVFQLVPQRFRKEIGVMTGLVGFGGGLGGFYLASSLGAIKKATGSASLGFMIFAALAIVALAGLTAVKSRWRTTWGAALSGARI